MKPHEQTQFIDEEQQQKIAKARRIAKETLPIHGTLAERYLRSHRSIKGRLPESLRFHPAHYNHLAGKKFPALVVLANNKENQLQAVQIISLDAKTANKACGKQSKISYGLLREAGVLINRGSADKAVIIAEGPETALSLLEALPEYTIYAALGASNFAHMPLQAHEKSIIFAADNDGVEAASLKQLDKAATILTMLGIEVRMIMPADIHQDFNDVLRIRGREAIRELFICVQDLNTAEAKKIKGNLVDEHVCEKCQKPLIRRLNKIRHQHFWGCSNYPACKFTITENQQKAATC